MQRILTSATLVLLLVATAAAFAITERLKLTKSALMPGTKVSKVFSPVCGCSRSRANIKVLLRRADTVTAEIVDDGGGGVRTLLTAQPWRRGELKLRWDGRTEAGARAADGVYRVRIHLDRQHQTIVLPNELRLDTKPPAVTAVRLNRDLFSPDGDRQADFVRFTYRLNERARLAVFLGGRRVLLTKNYPAAGGVAWNGIARGGRVRPGRYTLEVGALDLAGNATPKAERLRVRLRLRYIALASQRIVVPAGKKFEIGVSTDAVRYRWRLGARKGRNGGSVLRLTAPQQKGSYTLTVSERGHVDRARVVVR